MSTRPSQHAARTATITLASAALLAGALGGVAAADPPALNRDACAVAIAPAGVWPGTVGDGQDRYQLVSDAFDSYLSRQPACSADRAAR